MIVLTNGNTFLLPVHKCKTLSCIHRYIMALIAGGREYLGGGEHFLFEQLVEGDGNFLVKGIRWYVMKISRGNKVI